MQDKERDIQFPVVNNRLVKRFLGERHGVGFELDEYDRCHLPVEHDCIAPLLYFAHFDRHLDGDKRSRVAVFLHQKVEKILAYPFFRRESHPSFAPIAEDLFLILVYAGAHKR